MPALVCAGFSAYLRVKSGTNADGASLTGKLMLLRLMGWCGQGGYFARARRPALGL